MSRRAALLLILGTLAVHSYFITYGTLELFYNERVSEQRIVSGAESFDSLARNLLRGSAEVDADTLNNEGLFRDGKAYGYFNPFPAFLRMPLNAIFPGLYGYWNRLSCLAADALALFFFASLTLLALSKNPHLNASGKKALFYVSFLALAFGSPLIFLMSCAYIYHESTLWVFAWSLGALYYLFAFVEKPGAARALGLSLCAAAALLSKVTYGAPWVLITAALMLRAAFKRGPGWVPTVLCFAAPLAAALAMQAWYNDARFGDPFVFFDPKLYQSTEPPYQEFIRRTGLFNIGRAPITVYNYFAKWGPYFSTQPPWVRMLFVSEHPGLHLPIYKEWVISMPVAAPWLFFGGIWGAAKLYRGREKRAYRFLWLAFLPQWAAIFSFYFATQRYMLEFFPLFIYMYFFFLAGVGGLSRAAIRAFVCVCAFAIFVNVFSSFSWNIDFNWAIPPGPHQQLKLIFA